MNYFARRRIGKQADELLRHARHLRRHREDITSREHLHILDAAIHQLVVARRHSTPEIISQCTNHLHLVMETIIPMRSHVGLRENLEVLVVALAIAMAFRTYFIQPFKIPTGSMQPTLYGIHYEINPAPEFMDRFPLRIIKVAITGRWRTEIRARVTGIIRGPYVDFNNSTFYTIGDLTQPIPRDVTLRVKSGEMVTSGQILFAGDRVIGDHIFVDKVRWNLFAPKRGQVMVFKTDNINMIGNVKTHYIKRMIGLPNDRLQIRSPVVLINGKAITGTTHVIDQIIDERNGYMGYCLAAPDAPNYYLTKPEQVAALRKDQYFAMGDNTHNSFDSRSWGPVPQSNLVGPAFVVYWPISSRWGLIQ